MEIDFIFRKIKLQQLSCQINRKKKDGGPKYTQIGNGICMGMQ
jgi:hypothetical protein